MTAFPTLTPGTRTFTPGDRAHAVLRSMGGRSTQVRHSNVVTGQRVALSFSLLTEAQMLSIQAHYINRRGQFLTFSLPSSIWRGVTDPTLPGYSWRYVGVPQVQDIPWPRSLGIGSWYDVTIELEQLAEYAPPAQTGDTLAAIPFARVMVTPHAPVVVGNPPQVVAVPAAAVTVEAHVPTLIGSLPAAAVTVTAHVPTIIGSLPAAAVTVTAHAPTIIADANIEVPAAAVTVEGHAPIVRTPTTWALVGVGAVNTVTTTTPNPAIPAGAQEGDLLVAIVSARSNPTFTAPSGWSLATSQSTGNTSTTPTSSLGSGALAWVVHGASAPATQWTLSAANVAMARIMVYRPSSGTPQLIAATSNTEAANSATATTAGITTDTWGALVVAGFCGGSDTTVSAFDAATDPTTASGATDTTTAPTAGTWIERADDLTTSGADTTLAIADAVRTTPGATGTIQATAAASSRHVMVAAAFRAV